MTWQEKRKRKAALKRNLTDHLDISSNMSLPEVNDPRFARGLIYTISLVLVGVVFWAMITPVTEIASGTGILKTTQRAERIEHPDGGRVSAIFAVSGQQVVQGDRIVTFEAATIERELKKQMAALNALEAERSRLRFVLDGRGVDALWPGLDGADPTALLFWTEQSYLDAQLDLLASERTSIETGLSARLAQRQNLEAEVALLAQRLDRVKVAADGGLLSRNEAERLQQEVLQAERSVLSMRAEIASMENDLTRTQLRESELIAQRQKEAAQRLSEIESRITTVRLTQEDLEERLTRSVVRATVSGRVMSLAVANPNEVLGPGELIAEIVPSGSVLHVELEMPADRIGNVRVGMETRIKVLTFDFTRFGQLTGVVAEISPSSFENEAGETLYRVIVDLPDDQGEFSLGRGALSPGLTVMADVLVDERKIIAYLLKPLRLLQDRAFSEA